MNLDRYLDPEGKIKVWPSKHKNKFLVLEYLATKFEYERMYTEKEINSIIQAWHSFEDYFLLRRGLIEYKMMARTKDGAKYWKENPK